MSRLVGGRVRGLGVLTATAGLAGLALWGAAGLQSEAAPSPGGALARGGPAGGGLAGLGGARPAPVAPSVPPALQLPAPRGDLPGWQQVFVDDFDREALGEEWSAYTGEPGGDPYSRWEPSQVILGDGSLRLRGERVDGRWVTGGVSNWRHSQTYGKWEVQVRVDPSDEIAYHLLLWPQDEVWPPEIDFAESFDGSRQTLNAFYHGAASFEERSVTIDMSQWHVVGVEWEPGVLRFTVDGRVWSEVRSEADVPGKPMWLALQSSSSACQRSIEFGFDSAGSCSLTDVPPVADVQVDWVAVYARS